MTGRGTVTPKTEFMGMTITEIESAIEDLSPDEFSAFSQWFEEFEEKIWDGKIARDLKDGKLQDLISETERDIFEGNIRAL
jgi:hypothetical protein